MISGELKTILCIDSYYLNNQMLFYLYFVDVKNKKIYNQISIPYIRNLADTIYKYKDDYDIAKIDIPQQDATLLRFDLKERYSYHFYYSHPTRDDIDCMNRNRVRMRGLFEMRGFTYE